jgi:hypothetical protein
MLAHAKTLSLTGLVLSAAAVYAPWASAQQNTQRPIMFVRPSFPVNTNPQIAPGVSLLQYAYNTAVVGRAMGNVPPYLLGYNPYPPAVAVGGGYAPPVSYGGGGYGGGYPGGFGGGYGGGYGGGGYGGGGGGGYSAGGVDPLTGLPLSLSGGGFNSLPPWPYNGGGGYSPGVDLIGYGQLGLDQEKSRILREAANQARLDTRKKIIDTLAYIRANEYTFTKEQADIAKRLLERVQKTPTQTEIQSGRSLNILLKDLVVFKNQQIHGPTITLDEDVLKLVNVSGPGSSGNISLLRDNGQFTWPAAFDDKDVISAKERKDLDLEVRQLYQQAAQGGTDINMLRNVDTSLRTVRANLAKQVNNIPTNNYLEAQRFLDDFDAAVVGIKKGDVILNLDFQKNFVKGGRSVTDLVSYLGDRGLQFAPAGTGDERAYVALQAGLSAHSLAIHNEIAASSAAASKGS